MSLSDATREEVLAAARLGVQHFRDLNLDLTMTLKPSELDDHWSSCQATLGDNETPERIQWVAERFVVVEPHRETATARPGGRRVRRRRLDHRDGVQE